MLTKNISKILELLIVTLRQAQCDKEFFN